MATVLAVAALAGGVALVVVGAEVFAEHLEAASRRLGVSAFALALLLAGAEPEELATTVTARSQYGHMTRSSGKYHVSTFPPQFGQAPTKCS